MIAGPGLKPSLLGTKPFQVDGSGNVDPESFAPESGCSIPSGIFNRLGADRASRMLCSNVDSVLDGLLLMGCKNVALSAREAEKNDVRGAVKRFGGDPDSYRYHVLVVRPPGGSGDAPAQEIGAMPRHVCRGHFAEYGSQFGKELLFGKHAGRFFVPPHLKGK